MEDDVEGGNDEDNEIEAENEDVTEDRWLNILWNQLAGTRSGRRGRPAASGQDKIVKAANKERAEAAKTPNPAAEALGLGPCELAALNESYATNRPRHRGISATIGGRTVRRAVFTYHLTWVAQFGLIPSGNHGERLEYSHYCHQPCCINPQHGGFEPSAVNKTREGCRGGVAASGCGLHNPPCFPL